MTGNQSNSEEQVAQGDAQARYRLFAHFRVGGEGETRPGVAAAGHGAGAVPSRRRS